MSKKIKIMQIINDLNIGGAEILLLNICRGLTGQYKDFELKVVILRDKRYLEQNFLKAGIEVICLNLTGRNPLKKVFKIYSEIKNYNPDIVHTHLLWADRFGQIASFLAGVKHRICTVHNMEAKRGKLDRLTRFITSLVATRLVVVSDSAREFCIENKMYPSQKIVRIYNAPGFQNEKSIPRGLDRHKEHIRLINIGRLAEQKGQIYLIRAMNELKKHSRNISLYIYGEGEYEEILKEEAKNLNIRNVFFKGFTSNIQSKLKGVDIFIAPSLWEGFNMALVEAMSIGVPIIATNIPPHKEIFQDTEDYPFLIEPADYSAIVESVLKLIKTPDLYIELSRKCIEQARKYSIKSMIDNYYKFYKTTNLN